GAVIVATLWRPVPGDGPRVPGCYASPGRPRHPHSFPTRRSSDLTQPGTTVAGQQITPAVKLRALDALGNVATGFSGTITVALGSNPGGATHSGTLLVAAVGGVASFGDLSLNRTAPGYTLTASGGGLGPVTSTAL